MYANKNRLQRGFIPIFIIAIIIVVLGGFTIYNLVQTNTSTTAQNQTATTLQSTETTPTPKANTTIKKVTTNSKTVVQKKITPVSASTKPYRHEEDDDE
jgi:hypothetical protein